ncbi:MAG: hypothetical protein H0W64_10340 [Gammaproteobacteria bacterium]|nr:hypothetical protein [Gammaproteobacteria bacterium]
MKYFPLIAKTKPKSYLVIPLVLHLLLTVAHASTNAYEELYRRPFYLGFITGYGSTTWQMLVPGDTDNDALIISTPQTVKEGGAIWGFFLGYELMPTFALETNYLRYPNAKINFDEMSLVAFEYGLTELVTHTETASLMAKFMVFIPYTAIRAYSSAGVAGVHRYDQLTNCWRASPTFGLGLNYNFTERVMGEIGLNYTGGYGESELNPVENYVPFLYSAFLRFAIRF